MQMVCFGQMSNSLTQIHFDFDSFELSAESKSILDEEFSLINETSKISLTGYTDTTGSIDYNIKLSHQRCLAVKDYLISKGIEPEQIVELNGKGEQDEYKTNAKNRMVEISIQSSVIISPPLTTTERVLPIQTDSIENEIPDQKTTAENVSISDISTLEVGQTLALSNLSFIPGRHYLMPGSEQTLTELIKVLKDNPTISIEIQGHICCMSPDLDGLDKDTQTMNLSVNRAEYVYNYLIKNGISPYRLTFKGYGASKPLVWEITEEDRQKNRRVEILIVDN